jgi:ERCC4-related helicase
MNRRDLEIFQNGYLEGFRYGLRCVSSKFQDLEKKEHKNSSRYKSILPDEDVPLEFLHAVFFKLQHAIKENRKLKRKITLLEKDNHQQKRLIVNLQMREDCVENPCQKSS